MSSLIRNNPAFYLLIIQVFQLSANSADLQCKNESAESAEMLRSWPIFIFIFWNLEFTTQICQASDSECLNFRCNARRYSQSLSVLILGDPCCYFQKICIGSFFFADFTDAKLVSIHKNGKTPFYTLIIKSFLTFRQLRRFVLQSESAKSAEISKSWNFSFFDLDISKALLK